MMRRHFFPWCMFSYRLRIRTIWGPPDTRQCSSTSRLALGVSYRIYTHRGTDMTAGNVSFLHQYVVYFAERREERSFSRVHKQSFLGATTLFEVCIALSIRKLMCLRKEEREVHCFLRHADTKPTLLAMNIGVNKTEIWLLTNRFKGVMEE